LARGIGSLLLALFLHNAVRCLAFPFPLLCIAISAITLAFSVTLPVLMELVTEMAPPNSGLKCGLTRESPFPTAKIQAAFRLPLR